LDGKNYTCGFSKLAINLIKKMLETDSENRYNAGQILRHPWITGQDDMPIPMTFKDDLLRLLAEQQMTRWMYSLLFSS